MHAATQRVTQHPPLGQPSRAGPGDVSETAPCSVGVDRDVSKQNQEEQAGKIGEGETTGRCPPRGRENTVEHRHAFVFSSFVVAVEHPGRQKQGRVGELKKTWGGGRGGWIGSKTGWEKEGYGSEISERRRL